jgi:proline iminopeptidase
VSAAGRGFVAAAACAVALAVCGAPARAAFTGPEEHGRMIRSGPVSLYLEVRGSGAGTPLLVVNGGPGFGHDYVHCSGAWDVLARKRRVAFYDQRGTGRSTPVKPGAPCTLAQQIDDLDAVRAALGVDRVDLLGHSWGGYLVMAYAARHPEHIRHLMIVDSAAPKWSETEFIFKYIFPEGLERQSSLQFAEAFGDSSAQSQDLREYFAMLFYDTAHRDEFLRRAGDHFRLSTGVNAALGADLEKYDLNPELPKFTFPTLVATGRYDINVAPSTAWKIHQKIPHSQFVVFEKSGHLPYFEEPEAFVTTIEDFLAH